MLGAGLTLGTALAQTDQGSTSSDQMNQNQDQTTTETQTQTQTQTTRDQNQDEDVGMPDTAANWVALLLGGGALSGAGLALRRK